MARRPAVQEAAPTGTETRHLLADDTGTTNVALMLQFIGPSLLLAVLLPGINDALMVGLGVSRPVAWLCTYPCTALILYQGLMAALWPGRVPVTRRIEAVVVSVVSWVSLILGLTLAITHL